MDSHGHLASDDEEFDFTTAEIEDLNAAEVEAKPVQCTGQEFDVEVLGRRVRNRDNVMPQFGTNNPIVESAGFQRSSVWSKGSALSLVDI